MHYLTFTDTPQEEYPIVFLVQTLKKEDLLREYIRPFGLSPEVCLAFGIHQSRTKKKTPVAEIKEYITSELVPALIEAKARYVVCSDAEYFKVLTKKPTAEPNLGYVLDSEYGDFKVLYAPSAKQVFYDPPKIRAKIAQAIHALEEHVSDNYSDPGTKIIHFAEYPEGVAAIKAWLDKLLEMNVPLAIDIEGFDLKHDKCGLGSICFSWNQNEGIAFLVDYHPIVGATEAPFGMNVTNYEVRALLRDFFMKSTAKGIYHNIAFDVYVLIYQLFMKDILDTEGLLEGIQHMLKNWDCTKLITYLATNSCSGNKLGLKDQSQEYAGNYAMEDIKDITRIPPDKLLEYNLVDGLSTWFVHKKHFTTLQKDQQEEIYNTLFKPATADIIQMQLTGLPVNMDRVKEVRKILEADEKKALDFISKSILVQQFEYQMNLEWVDARNAKLKKKRVSMADAKEEFNPDSPLQVQKLLFDMIGLPILGKTKTGQPETGKDALKALKNHTQDQKVIDLLSALIDFKDVNKILTSFIPALENSVMDANGWHWMFGNFNLGGTVSGRLSSSKPNLQNLPASSRYAKLIKSCIQAPPGWLFCGLDFASLEDRISALTTKDPNKLKVYTDGYDGHCLRTFTYWPDQCVGIVDTVESINSIETLYKKLRGESKAPTFALTYQGTYRTLMKNCGFSESKAKAVEESYKQLYSVSIDWIQGKLDQAARDGYVTAAFGLRVRTPLLNSTVRGIRATPHEAEAEGRTAGNALGQSWCLLNSRAGVEVMEQVRKSEFRLDIRPCAQIHDAQYYLVREDMAVLQYLHKIIVKAVNWQNHPDITHPDVGLGGELSIFHPTWEHEITIPNGSNDDDIVALVDKHVAKLNEAA